VEWLWVLLIGAVGGGLNGLLLDSAWKMPSYSRADRKFYPGVFGTVLIGAAAALAAYWLGYGNIDGKKLYGISLLAGIGGSGVLTSLMQWQQQTVLSAQRDAFASALQTALTPTPTPSTATASDKATPH
jgi:hypothetical protein